MQALVAFVSTFRYFILGGVLDLGLTWRALRRAPDQQLPFVQIWVLIPALTVAACAILLECLHPHALGVTPDVRALSYLCAFAGGLTARTIFVAAALALGRDRMGPSPIRAVVLTMGCLASPVGAFVGFMWCLFDHTSFHLG